MFLYFFNLIKGLFAFTGSYSNTVFPPPLSKEEELKYIDLMNNGDENARSILIERNLRLVAHIVKKFESKYDETDDLISIGTIGLIKGIDTYSLDKPTRITTYAAKCIENEILMHFRANKKHLNDVSLNDFIGYDKDGVEVSLVDVLTSEDDDISIMIHNMNNIDKLFDYLNILTDREKEIICMRYGLFNYEEKTQKEIAKKLKISRSYVSRIEKRALTRLLREFIKSKSTL